MPPTASERPPWTPVPGWSARLYVPRLAGFEPAVLHGLDVNRLVLGTNVELAIGMPVTVAFEPPGERRTITVHGTVSWREDALIGLRCGALRPYDVWAIQRLTRAHRAG